MRLISISCAWISGILLGACFNLPLALVAVGLLPVLLAFLFKSLWKYFILAAACLFILFGAAFYSSGLTTDDQITIFNNQGTLQIEGLVSSPPEARDNITHILLDIRRINEQDIHGVVLIFVPRYPEYHYGDILRVTGQLEDPPQFPDFDYQAYLERQNIFSTMLNPQIEVLSAGQGSRPLTWIYNLRQSLSDSLSRALPEPQASLAQGIVLGIRSTIPDDLRTNLSITGTAHLLAISGVNLSIIAGLLVTLGLWVLGRRHYLYVWLTLSVIWFYALITGMQAPVIRAAIMASIFLLAELLGRQKHALAALAFSAALMIGLDPSVLESVSFQMSFLSMIGLILISPLLRNLSRQALPFLNDDHFGFRTLAAVIDSFCVALGAILAVWPVIAYNYGIISIIGPVATVLIAPALSPIILVGTITAIIGVFSLPVAQVLGWITWVPLSYMLWLINFFAGLPLSAIHPGILRREILWVYYILLTLIIWGALHWKTLTHFVSATYAFTKPFLLRSARFFSSLPRPVYVIPLLILAFLTSFTAVTLPDNRLHVSFLDVGEGDAILIQDGSQTILIDGGPSPQSVCLEISRKLPFWDRKLDLVILSHPHLDHLSGLIEVLKRYQVKQVLAPGLTSELPAYREWLSLIQDKNIQNTVALTGQQIFLRNGAVLEILNPSLATFSSKENDLENQGMVSHLTSGEISFLFTADVDSNCESELISRRTGLNCTVLKVAHHCSDTSTSLEFLSVSKPQYAVISCGADNTFGHPHPAVLERLHQQTVYRTDLSGTIEFITDGNQLWLKTDR